MDRRIKSAVEAVEDLLRRVHRGEVDALQIEISLGQIRNQLVIVEDELVNKVCYCGRNHCLEG